MKAISMSHRLDNFLLTYRSTPNSTTGVSPSSMLQRRHIRTRFDMLRPDSKARVNQEQSRQKEGHDHRAKCREFFIGQSVMVKNLRPGPDWVPGVIVERLGLVTYSVETSENQMWKRHVDHMKGIETSTNTRKEEQPDDS